MKLEQSINQREIEEKFKNKINERDLTIQELRDMKSKLSTKMIGETLEIHCETQFNLNRATAFKNSYFEKDNDASSGSKVTIFLESLMIIKLKSSLSCLR